MDVNRGMWSGGRGGDDAGETRGRCGDVRVSVRSGGDRRTRSGVDDRRTGAIDRGDAPRGREWRYTNRVAAAQGSSPRRKKAGFSTCFSLPLALPTVTTVVSNDHSGTSSLGGKSSSSSSKEASGTSSSSSAAAPRARQRSAKSARNAVEREPRRVARRAIDRARTNVCATDTRRGLMLGGDESAIGARDFTELVPSSEKTSITGSEVRGPSDDRSDCSPVVIRNPVRGYGSYY